MSWIITAGLFIGLCLFVMATHADDHRHGPGCGHERPEPTPEPTPAPTPEPTTTTQAAYSGGSDDFANAAKGVAIGVILTCGIRSIWRKSKDEIWTWCGDRPKPQPFPNPGPVPNDVTPDPIGVRLFQ